MRAFKGTLIAALLLGLVLVLVRVLEGPPVQREGAGEQERRLFTFEKQDLVHVLVERPDGLTVALAETPAGWVIEGAGLPASETMVNRVKHQLHDLTARAKVVDGEQDLTLYGLGPQAIQVTLTLRDGQKLQFKAGDPNPSSVSYYIQPLPGEVVYTVKKSAVDYYSLNLEEFRERRFASFESKDADAITAELPEGRRLRLQRDGEELWQMLEPIPMAINRDDARSLLGRVAVLKAVRFVEDLPAAGGGDLRPYGLDQPRARITIGFGEQPDLTVRVGARLPDELEGGDTLAYMMVEGERSVYTAKDGFLEDFLADPAGFRLRRFTRLEGLDVTAIEATLHRPRDRADDPVGTVRLRGVGDSWQWEDGLPVPGSTPRRLAMRAAGVEAEEFVADAPASLAPYGLDAPVGQVTLTVEGGRTVTLLLGGPGPSRTDAEGHEYRRMYMKLQDEAPVYLVEDGVVDVVEDALREFGRKEVKDEDKAERLRRIEEAQAGGAAPTPPPEP